MKILKQLKSTNKWKSISLEQAIKELEHNGYWKTGTTKSLLEEGQILWTTEANYKTSEDTLGNTPSLTEAFRLEIKRNLDKLTPEAIPKTHDRIQTKQGYKVIESAIIKMMMNDKISAGAAISQIEIELP